MNNCTQAANTHDIPFKITDPQRIPAPRYYDQAFFDLECRRLWPHVWQMACRLEQIPNVGDWVEYTILDKSVIVVRTESGVKAFHNVCRHRGVPLVSEPFGNSSSEGFTCPFHGWRWNTNGENTFVYGRQLFDEAQLEEDDIALTPVRVETWGGCAFINFDDKAPAYRETLGPLAERLEAHGVDNLRSEWWYATVLPANWKTAMEAFHEGFHVMRTHPQLQHSLPATYNSRYAGIGEMLDSSIGVRGNIAAQFKHFEQLSEGMAGLVHQKELDIVRPLLDIDLPEDLEQGVMTWFGIIQDQITRQLRARGENVPDLNAVAVSHPIEALEFLFPHYFLLSTFTSMSSYRVRPLGPESCLFEIWSLTHFPEDDQPEPLMEPVVLPFDSDEFPPIPKQDYSNIPNQQRGLHGGGFEFMRLAKEVEGLIGNYQQIIDGYLTGAEQERITRAIHKLGGNFDGPIHDLGL